MLGWNTVLYNVSCTVQHMSCAVLATHSVCCTVTLWLTVCFTSVWMYDIVEIPIMLAKTTVLYTTVLLCSVLYSSVSSVTISAQSDKKSFYLVLSSTRDTVQCAFYGLKGCGTRWKSKCFHFYGPLGRSLLSTLQTSWLYFAGVKNNQIMKNCTLIYTVYTCTVLYNTVLYCIILYYHIYDINIYSALACISTKPGTNLVLPLYDTVRIIMDHACCIVMTIHKTNNIKQRESWSE